MEGTRQRALTTASAVIIASALKNARAARSGYNAGEMPIEVHVEGAGELPAYSSSGSAGADLVAAQAMEIPAGGRAAVPTAVAVAIPDGYVGLVWPRSGLALRHGIDTLAGVIDSDYRGEVRVVLANHGPQPFSVKPGDRIAQLLVQRVERARFQPVERLDDTERGAGGFGSTGS